MKRQVNPLIAAIVILVVVAVALFVMYQKSQMPPPMVGEDMREKRMPQYEAQQSMESEEIGPASEDEPAEDAE